MSLKLFKIFKWDFRLSKYIIGELITDSINIINRIYGLWYIFGTNNKIVKLLKSYDMKDIALFLVQNKVL